MVKTVATAVAEATIPGIVIPKPPSVFFTFDPTHQGQQKIRRILQLLHEDVCAEVFNEIGQMKQYFNDFRIPAQEAVAIFENSASRKCFSPVCRQYRAHYFPEWAALAHWGVVINPSLPDKRVPTVANQIRGDFLKNFRSRVADPKKFPWGEKPTSSRKERKRRKREATFYDW